jgi:hypothetical protein
LPMVPSAKSANAWPVPKWGNGGFMTRLIGLGWFAMVLAAGAAGCGDDASNGGPDGGDDGGECAALGAGCVNADDCCSDHCSESGICVGAFGECSAVTQDCEDDADCCSGNCGGSGECVKAEGMCKIEALSCDTTYECCSGMCSNELCVPPAGVCQPFGNDCSSNAQCCSGICNGTCQIGALLLCQNLGADCDGGIGSCCSENCGAITNTCVLKAGDCKATGAGCSADFECCDGSCGEDNTCAAPIS